ncbi:hypothetical protein [Bifidobacterium indicum]|uniref:hypothetical protein n=1 Tax=Bifidobacterium indicum TaxID=1691 RepID=UPI0030D87CAC
MSERQGQTGEVAASAEESTSRYGIVRWWQRFSDRHETVAQFIVFFILSNGVTVLQLILMPVLKAIFNGTSLVGISFRFWHMGTVGGKPYYLFDYASGAISNGGGGGLAYFLAVEITLLIAQIINFFLQRNITFKSNSSVWKAAFWYILAYIVITVIAAALQGWYKDPIYGFFQNTLNWGGVGTTVADLVTMIINSAISFWVFFPIFKVIFKQVSDEEKAED